METRYKAERDEIRDAARDFIVTLDKLRNEVSERFVDLEHLTDEAIHERLRASKHAFDEYYNAADGFAPCGKARMLMETKATALCSALDGLRFEAAQFVRVNQ